MKKVVALILVLLLSIAVCSCACHRFSRIVVKEEPDPIFKEVLEDHLGEYEDFQEALDKIVDRYNKTYQNEDLYNICLVLNYFGGYFQDNEQLKIEYYSQFFDEVFSDEEFDRATEENQKGFAKRLLHWMYLDGMKSESVDFFLKFVPTIQDKTDRVRFSFDFIDEIDNDSDPNRDDVVKVLEWSKKLEKDCYEDVEEINQVAILYMISEYSRMLGDTKTADEYKEKQNKILDKLLNE